MDGVAAGGWGVFLSWLLTPLGSFLFLCVLGFSIAASVMRESRWLRWTAACFGGLFLLWMCGGVLGAMGVPVQPVLKTLGADLPTLLHEAGLLFARILQTAA